MINNLVNEIKKHLNDKSEKECIKSPFVVRIQYADRDEIVKIIGVDDECIKIYIGDGIIRYIPFDQIGFYEFITDKTRRFYYF